MGENISKDEVNVRNSSGFELPHLDGVNIEMGMQIWKDSEIYSKALLGFAHDYVNADADLTRMIEEGDMAGACQIIHTIKGVAGNLSITDVADSAGHINTALHDDCIEIAKNSLPALTEALRTVVNSIGQLETVQNIEEMPGKELDVTHLKTLIMDMLPAFDECDPYSLEHFMSELTDYLTPDQSNPILGYIEQFDFKGAKKETLKLAKTLQIDMGG